MKKIPVWGWVILILVVIGGVIGGTVYMQEQKNTQIQNEMVNIAKSPEAIKIYEERIKEFDENALTDKSNIKTYKIDLDGVRRNPMGGIIVVLWINNDPKLDVTIDLDKEDGKLQETSGGYNTDIDSLVKEANK